MPRGGDEVMADEPKIDAKIMWKERKIKKREMWRSHGISALVK
jgi:hypothetical protein